ncbi:hypothetical protein MHK74_10580 [Microbacterium aurum]|uniref:hypothetical protein n=1 Tax=Microbacterium aurum TaxID=36805 RepID=UPI001EF46BEA|nr:hypothetical protein [Microbacterium aurum]MCG7415004.1 hypothetical protein [Microbacterium aurum]
MTDSQTAAGTSASTELSALVAEKAKDAAKGEGFQAQIFKAIAVQRPVVMEYLRTVRREKPDATPVEILKELDSRYVATVTITSTGVGASAAIPGVGIPIALGMGVADLLFFYETSALYVLAVAELHGIPVTDPERAKPLVLGTLLGQKSQSEISKLVLAALPGGVSVSAARQTAGKTLPKGWGDVLTQQLPDSALAPLAIVIGRESLKLGGKLGAGTAAKAIPFGVGAVIGGVGSFTFGRDVVKASRIAFPATPEAFPEWLEDFAKPPKEDVPPSRAALALDAASSSVKDFGENVWGKVGAVADNFRSIDLDGDGIPDEARALTAAKRAGSALAGTAGKATEAFRSVDLDGDGVPDEARAVTAVKGAGSAIAGALGGARGKASGLFAGRKQSGKASTGDSDGEETQPVDA